MNIKKRGLGKGLSDLGLGALLGDLHISPTPVMELPTALTMVDVIEPIDGQLKKVPMDALQPGKYQPRKVMAPEALEELANSIRTQGVIQPIVVRPLSNQCYEIIAGERRWRAAQLAELTHIPAIVREINDETAMVMALIENIQRRDLNVIEEAFAFNRLMSEFQLTHQQVAQAVGKSRTTVTNIMRLLKLNADVRLLVENGQLEMGHARALLMLPDEQQSTTANLIVSRDLSARDTEDLVRQLSNPKNDYVTPLAKSNNILHALQDQLTHTFGVKVSVMQNAQGRGKFVIRYKNEKELAQIVKRMQREESESL